MKSVCMCLLSVVFVIGMLYIPQPLALERYNLGTYTFYYGSANFKTVAAESAKREKYILKNVRGESASFPLDNIDAEDILNYYRAELIFTETIGAITCYYAKSPALGESVDINGESVNLHIAVNESIISVGTPLIFGGF